MNASPPLQADLKASKPAVVAEASTRDFQRCVCEMKQLSFVGCERSVGETVVGGFSTVGRVKCWGGLGAFWGGVWGWLVGSTFFQYEGAGPLMVADPMVGWMMGAVEGGLMGGGLSAVGACVFGLIMPKRGSVICETTRNG
ncbi:MAG: hypothetical protein NTY98_03625 [Verrucomicrobia bacterium]|nr:hypothetical protein [Verrucomicrobiota bacterium]